MSADLLQPQVVEMLPHQPDHVLLARGQSLLLGDAIRDAVAVVAGRLLVVVDVDDSVAIVVDCQPVGVRCHGGAGRLSVVGAVPTRLVGVGLPRRPVRLHGAADYAALTINSPIETKAEALRDNSSDPAADRPADPDAVLEGPVRLPAGLRVRFARSLFHPDDAQT